RRLAREQRLELERADQQQREQPLVLVLEVQHRHQLRERVRAERLRLVDRDHGAPAFLAQLDEVQVELAQRGGARLRRLGDTELVRHGGAQPRRLGAAPDHEQPDLEDVGIEVVEHATRERRRPGADLAAQHRQLLALAQAAQETRPGVGGAAALEPEVRLRLVAEGLALQAEAFQMLQRGPQTKETLRRRRCAGVADSSGWGSGSAATAAGAAEDAVSSSSSTVAPANAASVASSSARSAGGASSGSSSPSS